MRIEVIADGKSLDRHEVLCKPSPGETIELPTGRFVVDDICHSIVTGRLQVLCSKADKGGKSRSTVQP